MIRRNQATYVEALDVFVDIFTAIIEKMKTEKNLEVHHFGSIFGGFFFKEVSVLDPIHYLTFDRYQVHFFTVTWIQDCACEVSVSVINYLPYELSVSNLALLSEGCAFEPIPVRLILAPCDTSTEPVDIKLIGMPR